MSTTARGLPHIYIVAIELKSDLFFAELVTEKVAEDTKKQERFKIIPFNKDGVDKKFLVFRLLLRVTFQTAEKEAIISDMVYNRTKIALTKHLGLAHNMFNLKENFLFEFEKRKDIHERKPYPED
jgi:hypothetical protein